MSITTTDRKAGPFMGDDVTTVFPFEFKVYDAEHLKVILTRSAAGGESELVLDTDYTVSLNADQEVNPGGSVTLNVALATGEKLTITTDQPATQEVVLTNMGGFFPKTIEKRLDWLTILVQQLAEKLARAVVVPISDGSPGVVLDSAAVRANKYLKFNAAGDVSAVIGAPPELPGAFAHIGEYASGDGTDETGAIQSWLNSGVQLLIAGGGGNKTYRYTLPLTIPANTVVETGGAIFQLGASIAGNAPSIVVNSGCRIDVLRIHLPPGVSADRVVSIADGCIIGRIEVVSSDQIANVSDKLDAAVYIAGDDITIGEVEVTNYDCAVAIYNANRVDVGLVKANSYGRGLYVRESEGVSVQRIKMSTASPNATTEPGYNGLLIEQASDSQFGDVAVSNSGEHAVRIGGGVTGPSTDIRFGTISAYKPGQCGFKILDGSYITQRVTVGEIHVTDCAATSATGSNEDPVRLENADDITIGVIAAYVKDKANCGYDGVYINGCQKVKLGLVTLFNPRNVGFNIVDAGDVSRQCRDIEVDQFTLYGGGAGIVVNSPTFDIQHIVFHDGYMRDVQGDALAITTNDGTGPGGVLDPCIFRFKTDSIAGSLWNVPSTSTNLYNCISTTGFYDSEIRTVTILDDAAAEIVLNRTEGLVAIFQSGNWEHSGIIAYDAAGTAHCEIRTSGHAATFVQATIPLSGTTGVDGNLTVSANGGKLYIENRTGATVTVCYSFLA